MNFHIIVNRDNQEYPHGSDLEKLSSSRGVTSHAWVIESNMACNPHKNKLLQTTKEDEKRDDSCLWCNKNMFLNKMWY